jgi:hypothetical protein
MRSYLSVCLSATFIFQTVNLSVIKVCICSFFFYWSLFSLAVTSGSL